MSAADVGPGSPRVLVSRDAFTAFSGALRQAAPAARFLVADSGGLMDGDGRPVTGEANPQAGWFSSDLFAGGRGAGWFVGHLLSSASLRWLHSSTAGTDGAFFDRLRARGVRVTSAHIYGAPIAEFTLRAVLDHLQQTAAWREAQRDRAWRPHELRELSDTVWLVVGQGDVGGRITATARALGARVVGVSRHGAATPPAAQGELPENAGPEQVAGLLPACDVVVLARPADPGEPPLVDAAFLKSMAPGSLLVNVARGSLVDEPALLNGLDEGRPGHAILDVFAQEPLPDDSPLWGHPGVTVTPHASGQGSGRYGRGADAFCRMLADFCVEGDGGQAHKMPLPTLDQSQKP